MLKPLKDPELYKRFETAKTYMMYHQSNLGAFFAGIIRRCEVHIVDSIPGDVAAAVTMKGIRPQLILAPKFFERKIGRQVVTLHHELRHLIYEHPVIFKDYPSTKIVFTNPDTGAKRKILAINIAADATINQYEVAEEVPPEWIQPELFGAPRGRNTPFYFHFLMENIPEGDGGGDDDDDDQVDPNTPLGGGSGGGQGEGEEPDERDEKAKRIKQKIVDGYEQECDPGEGEDLNPHNVWNFCVNPPPADSPPVDAKMQSDAIKQIVKEAAEELTAAQRGTLPDFVRQAIEAAMKPNVVPWQVIVRQIVGSSGDVEIVRTVTRRHKNLGIRPGIRIKPTRRGVVYIDSSGSMSDPEWKQAVSEVHHLWKQGVKITVVVHDAAISKIYEYNGRNLDFDRTRGGTDHTPCIQHFNENHRDYDFAMYLTDGATAVHESVKPKGRAKHVWVITPDGVDPRSKRTNITWGQMVKMSKISA